MKDIFILFLKHHNIYDKFYKNMSYYYSFTDIYQYLAWVDSHKNYDFNRYQYLRRGLNVSKAREGESYWWEYDDKWFKVIKSYYVFVKLGIIKDNQ